MGRTLLTLLITLIYLPGWACICPADSPELNPDVVFLGKVISVEPVNENRRFGDGPFQVAKLEVVRHYQGRQQDVMYVRTGVQTSRCGISFLQDSLYMVHAGLTEYPTLYQTSQCFNTRRVVADEVTSDVQIFRGLVIEQMFPDLMAAIAIILMVLFLYRLRKSRME